MFTASSPSQLVDQPSLVDDQSMLAFATRDRPHGLRATLKRASLQQPQQPQQGPSLRPLSQLHPLQHTEASATRPALSRASDGGDPWPSTTPSAPLTPRSLVTDVNDPAFSADPSSHPDHALENGGLSARNSRRLSRRQFVNPEELNRDDEPPTYEESISSDQDRQERLQTQQDTISPIEQLNVVLTPASPSVRPVSFTPPEDDGTDLAYLQDDGPNLKAMPGQQEDLSPGQWREPPPGLQAPLNSSRRASEPPRVSPEPRPQIGVRGFTSPPARPAELDRIDELDESGLGLHHRGPYEVNGQLIAPPRRALPFQPQSLRPLSSIQNIPGRPQNLNDPPPPMPFKLGLRPGQILPRMPPSEFSQTPRNSLLPPGASAPQIPMAFSRSRSNSGRALPKDPENIVYYPPNDGSAPSFPNPSPTPSHMNSRRPSPSSFNSDSVENTNYSRPSPPMPEPEVMKRHSSYEPAMQPVYQAAPSFVSAPSFASSRSDVDGPARGAGLHRPRQLVMPTPLQQDRRALNNIPPERALNNFMPSPPPAPATQAALIPMRPSKKGNLLKKRPTISGAPSSTSIELAKQLVPAPPPSRSASYRVSFAAMPAEAPVVPAEKDRRISRKLSKRRNV